MFDSGSNLYVVLSSAISVLQISLPDPRVSTIGYCKQFTNGFINSLYYGQNSNDFIALGGLDGYAAIF